MKNKIINKYCKANIKCEDCEKWQNGLECPDCQNSINYRVLPEIKIGDKIVYRVWIQKINRYGGKYDVTIDRVGYIRSFWTERNEYSVYDVANQVCTIVPITCIQRILESEK